MPQTPTHCSDATASRLQVGRLTPEADRAGRDCHGPGSRKQKTGRGVQPDESWKAHERNEEKKLREGEVQPAQLAAIARTTPEKTSHLGSSFMKPAVITHPGEKKSHGNREARVKPSAKAR